MNFFEVVLNSFYIRAIVYGLVAYIIGTKLIKLFIAELFGYLITIQALMMKGGLPDGEKRRTQEDET